jgi:transposase InsO family protein
MVQMDCFFIGRLSGAKGAVWQYTAIDVGSAYCWAELHLTPRNPSARWTSELARRVAADLKARGWSVEKVTSDNASEFRSAEFEAAVQRVGARHLFIRAGRPQTNGVVERVQETILDEGRTKMARRFTLGLLVLAAFASPSSRPTPSRADGPQTRSGSSEPRGRRRGRHPVR